MLDNDFELDNFNLSNGDLSNDILERMSIECNPDDYMYDGSECSDDDNQMQLDDYPEEISNDEPSVIPINNVLYQMENIQIEQDKTQMDLYVNYEPINSEQSSSNSI